MADSNGEYCMGLDNHSNWIMLKLALSNPINHYLNIGLAMVTIWL